MASLTTASEDDLLATAGAHAEAQFTPGLKPGQRWERETQRPPMPYDKVVVNVAQALTPSTMGPLDFSG